jgi:SAM-dependent methyltransferase
VSDADTTPPAARRLSFGSAVGVYARARPGYPAEAVEWLAGAPAARVLDVGAGTGKLAAALVAAGHDVLAVEPDEAMRAAFARALPAVEVRAGSAERLPFGDGSFDVVTAGQSFHWFDRPRALPELARVLRTGGRLAAVWNVRDERVPWVADLGRILRGEAGGTGGRRVAGGPEQAVDWSPWFSPVERAAFRLEQVLDAPTLVELASSHSYAITLPVPERRALLAEVRALAVRHLEPGGRLTLPYVTRCYRASRIG